MDLKTKSLVELKAMAYDVLANLEHQQKLINIINQEITRRLQPSNEERSKVADDTQPVSEGK